MKWEKRDECSSVTEVALRNMGLHSTDDINMWFKKSYNDEYTIDKLDEAVALLLNFKDKEVHIIGDYDVDGDSATTILYLALKRAGFKKVFYRTPKRFSEGFGLNKAMVEEIKCNDGLIITCDNGIAAIDAVSVAKERGLTVIVTDHHQPTTVDGTTLLPSADIIIDPNAIIGSATFNGYCGAGLAYKLAKVLLKGDSYINILQSLAAIATICDVMDLKEENYVIVRNGLKRLGKNLSTPGLNALKDQFNLTDISSSDVGFKIGPCLNAPGRLLDHGSMKSVALLSSCDYNDATVKARQIVEYNNERKEQAAEAMEKIGNIIASENMENDIPIVVYIPDTNEGIIGILSGRITEEFNVPSLVFTDSDDPDVLKGSGRSVDEVNLKALLDTVGEEFTKYGGHPGAAGMSVRRDNFKQMKERLLYSAKDLHYSPAPAEISYYDLEIDASQVSQYVEELNKFAPFGKGNEPIIFKVVNFSVLPRDGVFKKLVGKDGIKVYSSDVTGIGFGMADRFIDIPSPKKLNLYGELSVNSFNGKNEVQVEFIDFELLESEKVVTDLASSIKMLSKARA